MSKTINIRDLEPLPNEVARIMNTELKISVTLGIIYFIYLLSVPILTFTVPDLMRTRVMGGMSLTWFMTAIGAMIMAFVIAWLHMYLYQKQFKDTVTKYDEDLKGGVAH